MKVELTKDWCTNMAQLEDDAAERWWTAARDAEKRAQRVPLDPMDVEELWDRANADDAADEVHHAFARLLERAHGIGA